MNMPTNLTATIVGIVTALFLVLSGCGGDETEKLRSENVALKNKIASLEQEISQLRETADYHYQRGVSLLSSNNYKDAVAEFRTVIEKFPLSPLLASASQQLVKAKDGLAKIEAQELAEQKKLDAQRLAEEKRRKEEERYRPRLPQEAIAQWESFRNNEEKYIGTATTWKVMLWYVNDFGDDVRGYLEPSEGWSMNYPVRVDPSSVVASIHAKDWIVVTGKFQGVNGGGEVMLTAIRIKNEGVK